MKIFKTIIAVLLGCSAALSANAGEDKVVHIYNWNDYMDETSLQAFEKETGIKPTYDIFDGNEILQAKVLAGSTGYDIVAPGSNFLKRQIQAGALEKFDKSKLPNFKNLDPIILEKMQRSDPGNDYAIPYLVGSTGIGYNAGKLEEIFGKGFVPDSWDILFKKENAEKLSSCGIGMLNEPTEIFATTLHYLKLNENSTDPKDYKAAFEKLLEIRPYIRYFHSTQILNDLASGDICIAIGWSGDIIQASKKAKASVSGVDLRYMVPKEGALMYIDTMAITADAPNKENAYTFLNFVMRPDIMASISGYTANMSGNKAAFEFIDPAVSSNPNVFFPEDLLKKMYTIDLIPPKMLKKLNRMWTKIKTTQAEN